MKRTLKALEAAASAIANNPKTPKPERAAFAELAAAAKSDAREISATKKKKTTKKAAKRSKKKR